MSDNAELTLNLVPNDLLTNEDLVKLTGFEAPREQARILKENNIWYATVRNGAIRTTWYHVNNPIHLRPQYIAPIDHGIGWNKDYSPKEEPKVPQPHTKSLKTSITDLKL